MGRIGQPFSKDKIPFDITPPNSELLQTLGLVYHWKERRLCHLPRRIWRTRLASQALIRRRKLCGRTLEIWLGHAINLSQLSPECLSILAALTDSLRLLGTVQSRCGPAC